MSIFTVRNIFMTAEGSKRPDVLSLVLSLVLVVSFYYQMKTITKCIKTTFLHH